MQIGNNHLALSFSNDGAFRFLSGAPNGSFRPVLELDGVREDLTTFAVSGSERKIVLQGKTDRASWQFRAEEKNGKIELQMTARLAESVRKIRMILFSQETMRTDHFFAQNMRMGGCISIHFPNGTETDFAGHHFSILKTGADFLMISAPLRNRFMTDFTGKAARESITDFRCSSGTEFEDILEIDSGIFTFAVSQDPFAMMSTWSDENLEVKKEIVPLAPGWNSWDYYRWTITEKEVLENAEFIARDPVLSKHVKRIIVDDGWQYCYGEWEANHYFPDGMEFLAKELRKMGFEPGLWIAPSIVEPHARIAQLNPAEMMALAPNGQPCLAYECMRRFGFVLDPTVQKSRTYIRDVFARYAGMGYSYFKLDFLASTLNAPRFHDRSVPKTDMVRRIVESASEGIAGRAVILGCNYPYSSGNRYVSAARVGADIHAIGEKIRLNSISVAGTMWAAEKHWINDPDFALCRSAETSDDPHLLDLHPCAVFNDFKEEEYSRNADFTIVHAKRSQLEILLSLVLVSAGAVNLSDKMTRLNASGLELARKVVSAEHGKPGVPLDMFDGAYTKTWMQKLSGGYRLLFINWSDETEKRPFDPASFGMKGSAVDFWTGKPLSGNEIILAPNSCLLAEIRV